MANHANIEPHKFKPGQSGNPKGRPPKLPKLDELLADILGEEKDGVTAAEAILKRLRVQAAQGNLKAAEILLDRAYGKARQNVELSGNSDQPIVIKFPDDPNPTP